MRTAGKRYGWIAAGGKATGAMMHKLGILRPEAKELS